MESERPMDRLLCGDVGYGKTEVALRAAFKAVQDSKQVAYLAPTTVLTMQHFNTFVPVSYTHLDVYKRQALDGINTCPHGRPITIAFTKSFIEKQFKRII